MAPPVNAYGALNVLDTAEPLLRPMLIAAPASPNVPGCAFMSAMDATASPSMYRVASPSGVWLFSTVPVRLKLTPKMCLPSGTAPGDDSFCCSSPRKL